MVLQGSRGVRSLGHCRSFPLDRKCTNMASLETEGDSVAGSRHRMDGWVQFGTAGFVGASGASNAHTVHTDPFERLHSDSMRRAARLEGKRREAELKAQKQPRIRARPLSPKIYPAQCLLGTFQRPSVRSFTQSVPRKREHGKLLHQLVWNRCFESHCPQARKNLRAMRDRSLDESLFPTFKPSTHFSNSVHHRRAKSVGPTAREQVLLGLK